MTSTFFVLSSICCSTQTDLSPDHDYDDGDDQNDLNDYDDENISGNMSTGYERCQLKGWFNENSAVLIRVMTLMIWLMIKKMKKTLEDV